jgi:hypothetical protein
MFVQCRIDLTERGELSAKELDKPMAKALVYFSLLRVGAGYTFCLSLLQFGAGYTSYLSAHIS